jgi:hypothetical protein
MADSQQRTDGGSENLPRRSRRLPSCRFCLRLRVGGMSSNTAIIEAQRRGDKPLLDREALGRAANQRKIRFLDGARTELLRQLPCRGLRARQYQSASSSLRKKEA